jgi:hypothetical protein
LTTEVTIREDGLAFGETRSITGGLVITNAVSYDEDPVTGDLIVQKTAQSRFNSTLYLITGWPQLLENAN